MNRKVVLLVISVLAFPFSAFAQTVPYVSFAAGFNKMQQEDVDAHLDGSSDSVTPGEILTKVGPAVAGSFGLGLGRAVRVEIEGSYLSNHIESETGLAGENNATGTEKKSGIMGNAFYEFGSGGIRPYLGGGAGVLWVHEPAAHAEVGGVTVAADAQTNSSFAYQAIGGVAFKVRSGLSITAEYRYLALVGTRTYKATVTVPGVGSFPLTDESTNDVNHSFLFGIRYAFGG